MNSSTDLSIHRPHVLGNPYASKESKIPTTVIVSSREVAIMKYRDWLIQGAIFNTPVINALHQIYKMHKSTTDHHLVCFCKPQACHGDVIVEMCNSFTIASEYNTQTQGTTAAKHIPKEVRKIGMSNKFIGQAEFGTAARLQNLWSIHGKCNVTHYDRTDIVMLSANGNRKGAFIPVIDGELQGAYKLIDNAIAARACFVADSSKHLESSSYNKGELLIQDYLLSKGYNRIDYLGIGYWVPPVNTKWARQHPEGYECSSKGNKTLSAFYAQLNGLSIEYHYQVTIKGYGSIQEGKGKPPLQEISQEDLYQKYKFLWKLYFRENPLIYIELRKEHTETVFTDMFANTPINQARAISELLNEGL